MIITTIVTTMGFKVEEVIMKRISLADEGQWGEIKRTRLGG